MRTSSDDEYIFFYSLANVSKTRMVFSSIVFRVRKIELRALRLHISEPIPEVGVNDERWEAQAVAEVTPRAAFRGG